MVNSPRIMTGDGFPSPNLSRRSESSTGSPVIETPISTIPVALPQRKDTVTLSGPEILPSVAENTKLDNGAGDKALGSPILVKTVNGTEAKAKGSDVLESPITIEKSVVGTVEEKAPTGLGVEDSAVQDNKL
jgi:hypothetical protein